MNLDQLILILRVWKICTITLVLASSKQTWDTGATGTRSIHYVSVKDGDAILTFDGKLLTRLAKNEVVAGSAFNRQKDVLILKLNQRSVGQDGRERVRWYSRLLWIKIRKDDVMLHELLQFQAAFLQERLMSIEEVISISDDGQTIVLRLRQNVPDPNKEHVVRKVNPFVPSFVD